jgi:hypothetical protein
VITGWNPDHVEIPDRFHESLPIFDFGNVTERAIAARYRDAEIPFKIFNLAEFDVVSSLWTDQYLEENIQKGKQAFTVEISKSNHFMYWNHKSARRRKNYVPPTTILPNMTFPEWLRIAKDADERKVRNDSVHHYLVLGTRKDDISRSFVSRDLFMFTSKSPNFFIRAPQFNQGIQCRFGMRGVIAEAHYDTDRNMVAMLRGASNISDCLSSIWYVILHVFLGAKRYILTPPWTCEQLAIIERKRHPSFRHSVIDWSDPRQAAASGFDKVPAIDTVVRTGEVLYIPSYWFHYIVSLRYSIQCNSRSGQPPNRDGFEHIKKCMEFKD